MKFVIVTNNPRVRDELGQEFEVDFADITYREVLCKVRDMVYAGHKLLTHPLSGISGNLTLNLSAVTMLFSMIAAS